MPLGGLEKGADLVPGNNGVLIGKRGELRRP
jgi:hypothetical protein